MTKMGNDVTINADGSWDEMAPLAGNQPPSCMISGCQTGSVTWIQPVSPGMIEDQAGTQGRYLGPISVCEQHIRAVEGSPVAPPSALP
jgi:hypothetical protein